MAVNTEMSENRKTKIKMLGLDAVWNPSHGGRRGNRNAWKTGFHSAEMRQLRAQIRVLKRHAAATIALAAML